MTETQAARTGSAQHTKGLGVGGEVSANDCFRKHFKQHTDKKKMKIKKIRKKNFFNSKPTPTQPLRLRRRRNTIYTSNLNHSGTCCQVSSRDGKAEK